MNLKLKATRSDRDDEYEPSLVEDDEDDDYYISEDEFESELSIPFSIF